MLSNKLKEARLAKGLTQSEIAKKLYVTRQTVSRWEQGKTLPNIYVIQELSDFYGISLEELVVNTELENKEVKSMENVNLFALFGAILFNVFLFSLIIIFFGGFLLLSVFISLAMIFSPLIFAIFVLTGIQDFNVVQLFMTVIFLVVGLLSIPLLKKVSVTLFEFFKRYLKYNHKAVFY
ncbi:helix-turn-helix domain-containing protein [Staphylococcus epidermidis]|uniref:helix-turn-helix domain-containing protein n=1 Tax=Staphylococcus epidermidis TaxID=1282 RepID=UPI001C9B0180|nr:helix-turn-helix domain-containing protein [Staphylococcus epidermidis]MDE4586261.1 helix-turn-helix domain-containing protein [Staphylococcus epidermidis]MDE4586283.1 helix-turn-helix domain-containing protein [Staphylococcus epidermidis]